MGWPPAVEMIQGDPRMNPRAAAAIATILIFLSLQLCAAQTIPQSSPSGAGKFTCDPGSPRTPPLPRFHLRPIHHDRTTQLSQRRIPLDRQSLRSHRQISRALRRGLRLLCGRRQGLHRIPPVHSGGPDAKAFTALLPFIVSSSIASLTTTASTISFGFGMSRHLPSAQTGPGL